MSAASSEYNRPLRSEAEVRALIKAAKAMSDYWPTILPSKGVIPNDKIIALRDALAKVGAA